MMTWTYMEHGFIAVVTADSVGVAEYWLKKAFYDRGHDVAVDRTRLVPMVTSTRKVRILQEPNLVEGRDNVG